MQSPLFCTANLHKLSAHHRFPSRFESIVILRETKDLKRSPVSTFKTANPNHFSWRTSMTRNTPPHLSACYN